MTKSFYHILFSFFCIIVGSPTITVNAQQNNVTPGEIIVLEINASVPSNAVKVGSVKMGDAMRFSCGYDKTLTSLKEKAAELNGNLIKLTRIKTPDFYSTCYRMWADVYQIKDTMGWAQEGQVKNDSLVKSLIPEDANYALLYVYRPRNSYGYAISYNVHIDTTEVRMKNGKGYFVKLPVEGPLTIWTRTERRKELALDVKFGQVYFVRCAVQMGAIMGVPTIELSSNAKLAYEEYLETDHTVGGKKKNQSEDDVYIRSGKD
jgi:hypothetical protein